LKGHEARFVSRFQHRFLQQFGFRCGHKKAIVNRQDDDALPEHEVHDSLSKVAVDVHELCTLVRMKSPCDGPLIEVGNNVSLATLTAARWKAEGL
jgi:hypothetical protein